MLSDEEREEIKDVVVTRQKYITTILNLIEKQSKEIEELKNITQSYDSFLGTEKIVIADKKFFVNGYFKENFVRKDKIKAKIEELDEEIKVKKEIARKPMDRVSGRLLSDNIVELEKTKKVLQSLLEKE